MSRNKYETTGATKTGSQSKYAKKRKLKHRLCQRLGISPLEAPPITYLKAMLRTRSV